LTYELFNDEHGQKISKSKGNGLSMEEWLTYAAPESLQYFMFQKPKTAKRLYFDVIPKAVDEYHQQLRAYPGRTWRRSSPTRCSISTGTTCPRRTWWSASRCS
jgi:lysyl-tRNA synthetase class 1